MKKIIHALQSGKDTTREIRAFINSLEENTIVEFKGETIVHGMLPEDMNERYGDVGNVGVIPIIGKKNIKFKGGKFHNPKPAFPEGTVFYNDSGEPRGHWTSSKNALFKIHDCENLHFEDIELIGANSDEDPKKPGYPNGSGPWEGEHLVFIKNSKNLFFKDIKGSKSYGDFIYLAGDNFNDERIGENENITFINCKGHWIGRQGFAFGGGRKIYFEDCDGIDVRRGYFDVEPASDDFLVEDVVFKGGEGRSWLFPFPMGGRGSIRRLLIDGTKYYSLRGTTLLKGNRSEGSLREDIIIRNTVMLTGEIGLGTGVFDAFETDGFLIEGNIGGVDHKRSLAIGEFTRCTNVIIRNNKFHTVKYIVLDGTPKEQVYVYGNEGQENWFFKIKQEDGTWKEEPVIEYDVDKYGEPQVNEPDFEPYMGIEEPETPVEEEQEEEPGFPETPKDDKEEEKAPIKKPEVETFWDRHQTTIIVVSIFLLALIIAQIIFR